MYKRQVIRYGKEKKVGVWLWTVAATLFQHPHCYLDSISKWEMCIRDSINANFFMPVFFSDHLVIETAVVHLGHKSFTLLQRAVTTDCLLYTSRCV